MNTLDRTKNPDYKNVTLNIPPYDTVQLSHGGLCYLVQGGTEDVLKMEFVFNAGDSYTENPLIAACTNKLLEDGTSLRTSKIIADELDYYGAYLSLHIDRDWASVSLYCLTEFTESAFQVFFDLLTNSIFPKKEFGIYLKNSKESYQTNLQKVSFLSKQTLTKKLFSPVTPYSTVVDDNSYNTISLQQCKDFFANHYNLLNTTVFISGKNPKKGVDVLEKHLESFTLPINKTSIELIWPNQIKTNSGKILVEKNDAIQSSIRIGSVFPNRKHKDYAKIQLLNTVLGGYFGSRLMSNIREDKGYTYGIGSSVSSMKHTGVFSISTEVGVENTEATLHEIYFELNKLTKELIPVDELQKVKNYLMGSLLKGFDGPFDITDRLKTSVLYGMDFTYYENYIHQLNSATSHELLVLAQKYFNTENMLEVVAGKK